MFTNASCKLLSKQRNGRKAEFLETIISPVYWEESIGEHQVSNQGGTHGMDQNNNIFVVIPESALGDVIPKKDDKISHCGSDDTFTVIAVEDFRFGSKSVRHIEVTAK